MDLLFSRYASPFLFLNGMISTGRFEEFVIEFGSICSEEREERHSWEYFLSRVTDKSYIEFKNELKSSQENTEMSESRIETTINRSKDILGCIKPK